MGHYRFRLIFFGSRVSLLCPRASLHIPRVSLHQLLQTGPYGFRMSHPDWGSD
jgi:hypothetical protein